MAPTLSDGRFALTRSLRRSTPIHRGDLVVVDHAETGGRIVKRVIGLPGETVEIDGGAVRIDGVPLDEPYASPSYYRGIFHVPAGHYLLLGDNRDASDDSRTWEQPYVERAVLTDRLVVVRNPFVSRSR
ncbi:signal peptidase I [Gordonia amicalis]|nr:signal peptidase I [Gordonia amicalis]KAF0967568.1 hypothetical protein BPODLACK_03930 [Gordonia sp. YY1]UKO92081.1 signal peptidase I [Gordonia amicalis]UOG23346.1 signal peptidase I [Gordonia amicalis]UPW12127.1 signal peptidase I [Gordonia amicalis]